jgi:glyoxylase-like metal-dependent hydrolase (beta-lactamase superfamily II)
MSRVQVGRACVTRIVEFQFELGTQSFATTPPSGWLDNADLLVPDFFDPDTDKWRIAVQSWVVEVDGLTVVVDTGVGNDRQRPHMPPLDHLNTAFLHAWDSAGIDRGAVDVVINTHIHSDHVGWNTMLDRGNWVPTFPNARYLAPAADYRHFAPDGPAARQSPRTEAEAAQQHGDQLVFADSVLPVDDAGQLVQWADDYQISPSLRLRAAPGHTPGSSVLWLDAGAPAVFVGDITHSPLQVRRPEDPCAFDVDAAAATATRRRIFTEAADARAAVIPAHYPGHGGASIRAVADRFEIDEWLEIESL